MSTKARVLQIIARIALVLLVILAVFLAVTSMVFSFGGDSKAPNIFGYSIYIVHGGNFYQLKDGTAAVAESIWPDEVQEGEIILIDRYNNGAAQLAKVNKAELNDAVVNFEVETETGDVIAISQGRYIAKVSYCSDFLGALISFARSPFGVMTIALLPCLAIMAFELVKFIASKLPTPEVETVKLQQETPTFIPDKEKEALAQKREREKTEKKQLADKENIFTEKVKTGVPPVQSSGDEFTERLKAKRDGRAAEDTTGGIVDRADFSAAAKRRMASDAAKSEAARRAAEKPDKPAKSPDLTQIRLSESVREKYPAAKNTPISNGKTGRYAEGSDRAAAGEPDISLVFNDEEDKRYNIDDIIADLENKN